MKLSLLLPFFALAASTLAEDFEESAGSTGIYVEPKTGISFSAYQDSASGYTFGVALPTTPTTDFIGILTGKGTGWSGVSLGGPMLNKLLIAAWPNGKTGLVGTFRKTARYGSPAEATGTYTQTPIAAGTYTNATHWSYVFVCSGCILTDSTTFSASDTSATLGWALNSAAPATPASSSSSFTKHTAQGTYSLDLGAAKSSSYATWAGLAKPSSVAGRVVF